MSSIKFLKSIINPKFFELPIGTLQNKISAYKLGFFKNRIENIYPYLYVCNKTSIYDRALVSKALKFDFLFVKDEVVKNIYLGRFSSSDRKEFLAECKKLQNQMVSVVLFPEKNLTVFGNASEISDDMCELIFDMGFDIKFLTLIGSYFSAPVWANGLRKGKTKYMQQFKIEYAKFKELSQKQKIEQIKHYMPSSASIYALKNPENYYSNKLAENLETVVYCCPTCGAFFNLYSEFNCLKCNSCGSAVEICPNGEIILSKYVKSFDDLREYQIFKLKGKKFSESKPIIQYNSIFQYIEMSNGDLKPLYETKLAIFPNKIVMGEGPNTKEIKLSSIKDFELLYSNTIKITLSTFEQIILRGTHKENLYIIFDLIELLKDK